MSIGNLFEPIESDEFAARVNIASNFEQAIDVIRNDLHVRELVRAIKDDREVVAALLHRLASLSTEVPDIRFENPHDVALMTYAWLLNQFNSTYGFFASTLIRGGQNLWWSSKLATQIFEQADKINRTATDITLFPNVNDGATDRLFIPSVAASVIFGCGIVKSLDVPVKDLFFHSNQRPKINSINHGTLDVVT